MIEIEGIISNQLVFVLIDPGSSLSYISPHIVEKCKLKTKKNSALLAAVVGYRKKIEGHP